MSKTNDVKRRSETVALGTGLLARRTNPKRLETYPLNESLSYATCRIHGRLIFGNKFIDADGCIICCRCVDTK